jgi:hypothetical protein
MKNSIAASISILMLILIGLGSAPQALANGAGQEDRGKTYLVKSLEGEYLGTAKKVLVNPSDQADFVIVSLEQGEYGTKEIIVPFSAISFADENSIILDLEKEVLAEAPVFSRPGLTDPDFFEGVYRFYGMTPPWTGGKGEGQEER